VHVVLSIVKLIMRLNDATFRDPGTGKAYQMLEAPLPTGDMAGSLDYPGPKREAEQADRCRYPICHDYRNRGCVSVVLLPGLVLFKLVVPPL
jgi:hypothetical protein